MSLSRAILLIAILASIFGCNNSTSSSNNGTNGDAIVDAGSPALSDMQRATDIATTNEDGGDAYLLPWTDDAAPDAASADATPDSATPDATTPDAFELPDVEHVDFTAPDMLPADAAPTDGLTPDAAPLPILNVRFIGPTENQNENVYMWDEVTQVVATSNGNELVILSANELCATGADIPVSSVTVSLQGQLFGVIITAQIDGRDAFTRQYQSGQELSLLVNEDPLVVNDGECVPLTLTTQLPFSNEEQALAIEPIVTNVSVDTDLFTVTYGNPGENRLKSVRTVFDIGEGALLTSNGTRREGGQPPILVPVDAENTAIGTFEICSKANEQAAIRSMTFEIEGEPLDAVFPIDYNVSWHDSNYRNAGSLPGDRHQLAQIGEQFTWQAQRPDGNPEPLYWGSCLRFDFNLMFADADMVNLRINVVAIEMEPATSVEVRDFEYGFIDLDEESLPGPLAIIVEPRGVPTDLHIQRQGFGSTYQPQWFAWDGMLNPCALDEFGQPNPNADQNIECPITSWYGYANVPDRRFNVNIDSIVLSGRAENIPAGADVRVVVTKKAWLNGNEVAITIEIPWHMLDRRDNRLEIPTNWVLNTMQGDGLQIEIFTDEIPAFNPVDQVPPRIKFDLVELNATYANAPMPVHYSGYDAHGNWGENNELPELGPWITFHPPELWNGGADQAEPAIISIAEFGPDGEHAGENIVVLSARFRVPYASVNVCEVVLLHGTNKDVPPVESLGLNIGGQLYGLLEWDRNRAVFTAPEGQCALAYSNSITQVELTLANPTEATDPLLPLNFRIVQVTAYPQNQHDDDHALPLLMSGVRENEGQAVDEFGRVVVSHLDPIVGYVVHIVE